MDRLCFKDINLKIERGMTLAIVGGTGSGKSTLVNLIPRIRQAERGTVFIDGVDIQDIPLQVLRSNIGFVEQEPFLFSDYCGIISPTVLRQRTIKK